MPATAMPDSMSSLLPISENSLFLAVAVVFVAAMLAPVTYRLLKDSAGWVIALIPAGIFAFYLSEIPTLKETGSIVVNSPWIPYLGVDLGFRLDGLSLLFALLISGIGTLIIIYAGGYLKNHPQLGRFYLFILFFMGAMLGVVTSDNLLLLFVFWELTSLSSYLLIGFNHEKKESRSAALQALLVTFTGGQALLAGLILIGFVGGYSITGLLATPEALRQSAWYLPALLLILAGAFTKSAQTPFHFWLPGAMAAPTPVSAYLHSATMVTAGVFLMARLFPILGGTAIWTTLLTFFGALTMVTGAVLAVGQTDLKRLLAYSTVSALGTLTMLLGIGTVLAVQAAALFLLVHSLYKGALFMVAGSVDHETGTREVPNLGGLIRSMPITTIAASLAALAMCGLPPVLGFISKELIYEASLAAEPFSFLLTGSGVLANALGFAVALTIVVRPFYLTSQNHPPKHPHEAPLSMWLGPILLASLGALFGLFPWLVDKSLLEPAANAIGATENQLKLKLWHGVNPALLLSGLTILIGLAAFYSYGFARRTRQILKPLNAFGPERIYENLLGGLLRFAEAVTRLTQHGYLRGYVMTVVVLVGVAAAATLSHYDFRPQLALLAEVGPFEITLALLMASCAVVATMAKNRLTAVALLGVVGFSVALIFAVYGAPDLALTQFLVETLTLVLFVIVVYHLPEVRELSSTATRIRDAIICGLAGLAITFMILKAQGTEIAPSISGWLAENVLVAQGRNIVNVILVDFRGLDTLGEITVLGVAALGVYALMQIRQSSKKRGNDK